MNIIEKIKRERKKNNIHKALDELVDIFIDYLNNPEILEEVLDICPFCQCNLYFIFYQIETLQHLKKLPEYKECIAKRSDIISEQLKHLVE
jgi:hypothetical protein